MSGSSRAVHDGRSGDDAGPAPLHRERLWPSVPAWGLVALALVLVLVTLLPLGRGVAVTGAVVAAALAAAALVRSAAVVEVTHQRGLRAGRTMLPSAHVGATERGRGDRARALRGVELDARTHLVLRGWVDPVVLVAVDDPDDPTPSWLVSTRHPDHLAAALAAVRTAGGPAPQRRPDPTGEGR